MNILAAELREMYPFSYLPRMMLPTSLLPTVGAREMIILLRKTIKVGNANE